MRLTKNRMAVGSLLLLSFLAAPSWIAAARIRTVPKGEPAAITIWRENGVSATRAKRTVVILRRESGAVDRDFGVAAKPLEIRLYSSHPAFARQLKLTEHLVPEGSADNTSNIVKGVLRLGPYSGGDAHRLAHVYTEWILDRMSHNVSDLQPRPAWLYDGLAEFEADRIGGVAMCRRTAEADLPLSRLVSPASWWKIRGTPLGPLEYCEAKLRVQQILAQLPWGKMLERLRHSNSWAQFAHSLGVAG